MLFNSLTFFCFLPIVFVLYWSVRTNLRVQNIFLLFASYVFYGWWDVRFLTLIIASTAVDFILGKIMDTASSSVKRKLLISASMIFNLGLLGVFKYYNFFIENFVVLSDRMGLSTNLVLLKIILPVGISFYTFQTMSYTIDIYRKKLKHTSDFIAFAAFVGYFPQLVAGPIERAAHLLPQLGEIRVFNSTNAANGLRQALWGFFKKVVIADAVAPLVDLAFSNPESYSSLALILGAVLFSIQIYCDFSGYSDIAIGISKLFGIELKQNFRTPYFSRDIGEFWRRWHISLSTWFRDYIYIPLGGSKGSTALKIRNTFAIFLVSGFWHGANWTFIFWGLINAILFLPLMLSKGNRKHLDHATLKDTHKIIWTFTLTTLAWIFFRADSLSEAMDYLQQIIRVHGGLSLTVKPSLLLFITLLIIGDWLGRKNDFALSFLTQGVLSKTAPARIAIYMTLAYLILLYSGGQQTFIYFQF
ncbi:MAG: MBOAT family O-acyltransferase [Schleiferiaceae bacterium]|jgi:alginate O-acetyltransferase complex protein AlgI|tara:strand:+ start:899 stop:2317 length:1419 start_codon:yes stop_codon:yes gene_type:complete